MNILFDSISNLERSLMKMVLFCITLFLFITFLAATGGCSAMWLDQDSISELSFSHDGKKVVFDRCKNEACQIQVYDLETGELAAYQSPKGERWTMGKYSYDGKQIAFSVMPVNSKGNLKLSEMQIAIMDADGKNFRKVTTGPGAKLYPTFSHSGKKVLYARAAHIRQAGGTPAGQYDAWEVNLETGEQTQLTFFEYYYMGNLTYFPDDERFIYYGEMPGVFPGARYGYGTDFNKNMVELARKGMGIHGLVVMKGQELIPNPYRFPPQTFPKMPLLNHDGSILIYEKSDSGDFYLYSESINHKRVSRSGSVRSVAISPSGDFFGSNFDDSIFVTRISDGIEYRAMFLRRSEKWDENVRKMPYLRLIPGSPSRIISR